MVDEIPRKCGSDVFKFPVITTISIVITTNNFIITFSYYQIKNN